MIAPEALQELLRAGDAAALEALVRSDRRSIRRLVGFSFHTDEDLARPAAVALGLAARHHPKLIGEVARRLVWAMNEESGTNALSVPRVLQEIAGQAPELLLPLVGDLFRLSADAGLREGLAVVIRALSARFPERVAAAMGSAVCTPPRDPRRDRVRLT